jgi:hypothetical protein
VKKISTVAKGGNDIFKESKLTIDLDLGDRTSHYCILDEVGNVILEHSLPTDAERNPASLRQDPVQSNRAGNWDPFTVGKLALDPVGPRSDRGSCTQRASDRRE